MEAASRPVLEPLADLPVEAPIESGLPTGRPAPAPAASVSTPSSSEGFSKAHEPPAGHELIDPEELLGPPPPLAEVKVPMASRPEVKEEIGELIDPDVLLSAGADFGKIDTTASAAESGPTPEQALAAVSEFDLTPEPVADANASATTSSATSAGATLAKERTPEPPELTLLPDEPVTPTQAASPGEAEKPNTAEKPGPASTALAAKIAAAAAVAAHTKSKKPTPAPAPTLPAATSASAATPPAAAPPPAAAAPAAAAPSAQKPQPKPASPPRLEPKPSVKPVSASKAPAKVSQIPTVPRAAPAPTPEPPATAAPVPPAATGAVQDATATSTSASQQDTSATLSLAAPSAMPSTPPASAPAASVPSAPSAPVPSVPAARAAAPAPAAAIPAAAVPVAAAASSTASPAMDRDFIARNQIVERYLSGRLPLKGATDFERFCKDNPEVLDELGLPERVNAGLRLLEASGKPEPWQEAPKPFWTKTPFVIAFAAAAVVLGIALAIVAGQNSSKSDKIAKLLKTVAEQPLDAATATRAIRLMPSRDGASNTPAVTIGGGPAELVDFKIDESRSPYKTFTVTIDRADQGRVGVLHNLVKDTNGNLRIALNSSALGPGNYQLAIEGLSWRGDPEPDSWVTIRIVR